MNHFVDKYLPVSRPYNPGEGRILGLDLIKLIACIAVIIGHANLGCPEDTSNYPASYNPLLRYSWV